MFKTQSNEKPSPAPGTDPTEAHPETSAQILERIQSLRADDAALAKEDIVFHAAGTKRRPSDSFPSRIKRRVAELLSGDALPGPVTDAESRYDYVLFERQSIATAIEQEQSKYISALCVESRIVDKDLELPWKKNIQETCKLVLKLQDLGVQRNALRAEWITRTGLDVRPVCGAQADKIVPGVWVVSGPQYELLRRARESGIIV